MTRIITLIAGLGSYANKRLAGRKALIAVKSQGAVCLGLSPKRHAKGRTVKSLATGSGNESVSGYV